MLFNRKCRKLVILTLAIALVSGLFAGCGKDAKDASTKAGKAGSKPQVLTLGASNDFKNCGEAKTLILDTLLSFKEHMDVAPNLIESWDIKDNGATYVLHLKKGVKFHNGKDLDAEVVKFSINYWGPYKNTYYQKYLSSMKVIDNATLEVKFNKSYSPFLIELATIYATLPDTVDDKGNMLNWIGTGPFVLKEYQTDQKAVLNVNADYWNKEKMPKLEKVTWQVIPDENSKIMALKNGQIDAVGISEHFMSFPYVSVSELEQNKDLKVMKLTEQNTNYIETYSFNYKKGLLTDLNLRKAVALGIDRETMCKKVLHGVPYPAGHFLTTELNYSPKKEKPYAYDPKQAKEILDSAGYKDTNSDGMLEKNGVPLKLKILIRNKDTAREEAVFVQESLKKIGIGTEIESLDANAFGAKTKNGDFDICATHGWTSKPVSYMMWRGNSDKYDQYGIGFRADPKFDEFMDAILTSTDENVRVENWNEIWKSIYAFYPGTPICKQPRVFVFKKNLKGFKFCPDNSVIDLSEVVIE